MFNIFDDDNVVGIDPRQYNLTRDDICHESKENVFPLRYSSKIHSMQLGIDLRTGPLIIPTPITTTLSAGVRSESEQMAFLAFCGPTTTTSRYDKTRTLERYLIAEHTRIINYFRDQYPISISNVVILQCRTTAASWVGGIASSRQVGVQGGLSLDGVGASLGVVASEQHGWQLTHGDRLWGEEQTLDWQPCIVVQPLKLRKRERLISRLSNAVPVYGGRAQQSTLVNPHRIGTGTDLVAANSGMHGSAVSTLGASLSETGFDVCFDDDDGSDQSDEPLVNDEHGLLDELLDFVLDSWPEVEYAIGSWETIEAYVKLYGHFPENWYTDKLVTAVIQTSSETVGTVAYLVALRSRGTEPAVRLAGAFDFDLCTLPSGFQPQYPNVTVTNAEYLQATILSGPSDPAKRQLPPDGSMTPRCQTLDVCSSCKATHHKCEGSWPQCGTCSAASLNCSWGSAPFPVPTGAKTMARGNRKRQRGHDDASGADDEAPAPGRRHLGTACANCRESRNKCDGRRPVCSTCIVTGRECSYARSKDRVPRATARALRAQEAEIKRPDDLLRETNLFDARTPGKLILAMPDDVFGDSGESGSVFRGASPAPSYSSLPGLSSPWSGSISLPSPLSHPSGQFLEMPVGLHGRAGGGYSTDDDLPRDGQMGLPLHDVYGKGSMDMQEGPQLAAATTIWMGTGVLPSPSGVTAATMNFSAMGFNATERQIDIGLAYANSGPGLIAPGVVQGYGMPVGSFDVDTSLLFEGTSMDAAFRNKE